MSIHKTFQVKKLKNFLHPGNHEYSLQHENLDNLAKKYAHDEYISIDWKKIDLTRIVLINEALSKLDEPSYLEIGTHKNECFNEINVIDKIGVDPLGFGKNVIKTTSDDFFEKNQKFFDVIFIDGLHTYEQVRKDTINSLKFLKKGGYIFFHDMIPLDWRAECPYRLQGIWNGDVWKVSFELQKTKGINFFVAIADHGVGVLSKMEDNIVIYDNFEYMQKCTFKEFCSENNVLYKNKKETFEEIRKK